MKMIIGNKLVLSDQETPDKIPEHYVDAEFHAQSKYRIHSGQILTVPDESGIQSANCSGNQMRTNFRGTTDTLLRHRIGTEFSGKLLSEIQIAQTGTFSLSFESQGHGKSISIQSLSNLTLKWDKKSSIFHDLDLNCFIWSRCTDNVFQGRTRLLPRR